MTVFPNLVEQRQQLEKGILANEESSLISLGQHNWWRNAILLVLHDAVEDATTHGAITTRRPLDWNAVAALKSPEKVKSIQTLLVHSLTNSFYPTSPEELFCRRFDRWDYLFKGSKEGAAKRAQLLLTSICKKVPPAVLAAWMHTALNGWCTARRFQTQGPCRLSRSCRGEDSVEHYSKCRSAWCCAQSRLRISPLPRCFERFLGLQAESVEEAVLLVVQQAAVYHAVNNLRARNIRAADGEAEQLISARIRRLGTLSQSLARLLKGRWIPLRPRD